MEFWSSKVNKNMATYSQHLATAPVYLDAVTGSLFPLLDILPHATLQYLKIRIKGHFPMLMMATKPPVSSLENMGLSLQLIRKNTIFLLLIFIWGDIQKFGTSSQSHRSNSLKKQ